MKILPVSPLLQSLFKMVVDAIVSFSTAQGDFDMIKACLVERLPHYCVVIFISIFSCSLKEGLRRSYRNSDLDPEGFCRCALYIHIILYAFLDTFALCMCTLYYSCCDQYTCYFFDCCRSIRLRLLLPTYWSSFQRDSEIDSLTVQDLMVGHPLPSHSAVLPA